MGSPPTGGGWIPEIDKVYDPCCWGVVFIDGDTGNTRRQNGTMSLRMYGLSSGGYSWEHYRMSVVNMMYNGYNVIHPNGGDDTAVEPRRERNGLSVEKEIYVLLKIYSESSTLGHDLRFHGVATNKVLNEVISMGSP